MKNSRRFTQINRVLRFGSGVALISAAAAMALVAVKPSNPSLATSQELQWTEDGKMSAAFAKHREDLFAAKVGAAGESPASWADENYKLNGGDQITARQITGARTAFNVIQKNGVGKGKTSTASWFSLGPKNAIYPAFLNRHGSQYVTSGRITALAIAPTCTLQQCTLWVAAAGGGVWKTDKALGGGNWVNVSDGFFGSGAIGALTYDTAHSTLYAGTGEDAAAGDAEAGVGVYKSTDGGKNWTALGGNSNFTNRAIRTIAIDPNDATGNTIYVTDGRGVHGISSTTAGAVSQIPTSNGVGVWKSSNGGATFTLAQHSQVVLGPQPGQTFESSFGSSRGATALAIDPTHPGVIYASAYNVGIWRSTDNGVVWTQIHSVTNTGAMRSEFAVASTPDGHTRMYSGEGDSGTPYSRVFVAEAVESGTPTFVDKTSSNVADAGYATYNFCTGQCWYDQRVFSPAGYPNMVYVLGSYTYGEDHRLSNARAVLLSTDGGNTFTDETDAALLPDGTLGTDASHVGLHPDQHAFAVNPNNPNQFFEGSDGGLMRSDGTFTDISSRCDGRGGLSATELSRCKQLLSRAPTSYTSLNNGLQTLQFQSLSVNPANAKNVQGGTQDNGTFETTGSSVTWPQTIFGDGGLSGFDTTNPAFRFHTYYDAQVDVNFNSGAPPNWDWISDPFFFFPPGNTEARLFYLPIITDPAVHGTMFVGLTHVWRTKDDGGPQAYLDQHCNEFTGDFTAVCGDWEFLDGATLTSSTRGTRSGSSIGWISRTSSDSSTLWAATTRGRVFISKNADAAPATAVTFTRLDTLATNSPGRPISSISVDPANPNHAYISYLSYNTITSNVSGVTPLETPLPGHVFSVTYDPTANSGAGGATWTDLEGTGTPIGDQPVNGVAYDNVSGDLYASTDFGVVRLAGANPANAWTMAAPGLPVVTVAGLTINPGARQLLAATHGRGAYQLTLP
jgi:hypothetical protein